MAAEKDVPVLPRADHELAIEKEPDAVAIVEGERGKITSTLAEKRSLTQDALQLINLLRTYVPGDPRIVEPLRKWEDVRREAIEKLGPEESVKNHILHVKLEIDKAEIYLAAFGQEVALEAFDTALTVASGYRGKWGNKGYVPLDHLASLIKVRITEIKGSPIPYSTVRRKEIKEKINRMASDQ